MDSTHPDYQQLYKLKAQAKLSGLTSINEPQKFHERSILAMKSVCDNQGVIKTEFKSTPQFDHRKNIYNGCFGLESGRWLANYCGRTKEKTHLAQPPPKLEN